MSGQKTKPTQHSVKALLALGIQPDLIVCRSPEPLQEGTRKKISQQCNIRAERILSAHDVGNLFHVPKVLADQKVVSLLSGVLRLHKLETTPAELFAGDRSIRSLDEWNSFAHQVDTSEKAQPVVIAFVGKYNKGGGDAYQSVIAALHHAAVAMSRKLKVEWIDATDFEVSSGPGAAERLRAAEARLRTADGVFIPGGFGDRGIEGKARAAGLAREWKKPYLGVCLGMQVALIQLARDVCGLADATSEEFDKDKTSQNHVFVYMPEVSKETMGANMRLGTRWVEFSNPDASFASALYGGVPRIMERHRHRYEFNVKYKERMEARGVVFAGQDESKERMDVIELPLTDHPFYLGVQYHPEYKSRPGQPSPPFYGFVAAACAPGSVKEFIAGCRGKGPDQHWTPFRLE